MSSASPTSTTWTCATPADPEPVAIPIADTRELRRRVLRPHQTIAELSAQEPADAHAVGVFDHTGRLIATGVIALDGEEPDSWRIRGMASEPDVRGGGAGTAVLEALVRHATEHGARRIWCNARTPALSLYRRAGFRDTSAQFELPDIGPHVVMERPAG